MKHDWLNDTTYKDVVIDGSTFKGKPYEDRKVLLNSTMVNEYLPAVKTIHGKGLQLLCTAMAHMEGFNKGTRAYKTNNPGNIGNTDSGANNIIGSLQDGIRLQAEFITAVAMGKKKSYPMGKLVFIKPAYSAEIARNADSYQKSPWVPGYKFTYTGRLDQFVKIYSTGARSGNTYINTIVSYFKQNGIIITAETTLQDIINIL